MFKVYANVFIYIMFRDYFCLRHSPKDVRTTKCKFFTENVIDKLNYIDITVNRSYPPQGYCFSNYLHKN